MNPEDLWDLLRAHGISPDSATAIVQSHAGMSNADLWDRLVHNGASNAGATQIVQARGTPTGAAVVPGGATASWGNEPAPTPEWQKAAAHVLNTAQGLPGVKAYEAGAGWVGNRLGRLLGSNDPKLSYEQSLNALNDLTSSSIPPVTRGAEQIMGGAALFPELGFLNKLGGLQKAAATGALLGGAGAVSNADPNVGVAQRLKGAVTGTALGGGLGAALAGGAQLGANALGSVGSSARALFSNAAENLPPLPASAGSDAERAVEAARNQGIDYADRIFSGRKPTADEIPTYGRPQMQQAVNNLPPAEQQAWLEGFRARTGENLRSSMNPLKAITPSGAAALLRSGTAPASFVRGVATPPTVGTDISQYLQQNVPLAGSVGLAQLLGGAGPSASP